MNERGDVIRSGAAHDPSIPDREVFPYSGGGEGTRQGGRHPLAARRARQEDERMRQHYETHLDTVHRFLASRACVSVLRVKYRRVLERPHEEAQRTDAFLGGGLDVARMADIGDPALDRNRSGRAVPPW
jgi:hypothetical protein